MHLKALLTAAALCMVSVASPVRKHALYEEDVHFTFTYVLMRLACFTHEEALQIASADQGVDDNGSTGPGLNTDSNSDWHAFGTKEDIARRKRLLWDRACKKKSLVALGEYFHFQEDSHSHVDEKGEPYGPGIGHAGAGHQPDRVPNHPDRARAMAKEKLEDARKFIKECLDHEPAAMIPDDMISFLIDAVSMGYSHDAFGFVNEADLKVTAESLQRILDKWFKEGKITKEIKVPQQSDKLGYKFDKDGNVLNQDEIDKKLADAKSVSYVDPGIIKNVRVFAPEYAVQGDVIYTSAVVQLNQPLPGSDAQATATNWAHDWLDTGDEKILTAVVVSPDAKTVVMKSRQHARRFGWAPIALMVGSRLFASEQQASATCVFPADSRPQTLPLSAPRAIGAGTLASVIGDVHPDDRVVLTDGQQSLTVNTVASSSCAATFIVPADLTPGSYHLGLASAAGTIRGCTNGTEVYAPQFHISPAVATTGQRITLSLDLDHAPVPGTTWVIHNLSPVLRMAGGETAIVPVRGQHTEFSGVAASPGQIAVTMTITDESGANLREHALACVRAFDRTKPLERLRGRWSQANMPAAPWKQ